MYLAPLNYDRYFRKVFSDTTIAKSFLEDFLGVNIQSIEMLKTEHNLTDDSRAVKFDFRCKIDDRFVIIDMQQWFKPDIVHRFYVYHCINTALQLEKLPLKSLSFGDSPVKEKKIKDYSEVLPVITLIWLADDNLNFTDDYVSYTMIPESASNFIRDTMIWEKPVLTDIVRNRENVLNQLENKSRSLDFLMENKLIYAFQKNIVNNGRFTSYHKWFELAEKTRNRLNKKAEFLKYKDDQILLKIMERISKEALSADDFTYIDNYEEYLERVKRYELGISKEARKEGMREGEKRKAFRTALKMIKKQASVKDIIELTELSEQNVLQLQQLVEKHGDNALNYLD